LALQREAGDFDGAEFGERVRHPPEEGRHVPLIGPLRICLDELADRLLGREPQDVVQGGPDPGRDRLDGTGPVHLHEDPPAPVEIEERSGAFVVDPETVADGDLVVIGPAGLATASEITAWNVVLRARPYR
jgi:hypothetical protein